MRYYIGVDCSKFALHIAVLDEDSDLHMLEMLSTKEKKDIERMFELKRQFEDWLLAFSIKKDINIDDAIVTVEGPIMLQNVKTSFDIARSVNGVEMACCELDGKCFEVQNTTWKKSILGNGKSTKADIMKFAETKWGKKLFIEQDHADAACLALHNYILLVNKKYI